MALSFSTFFSNDPVNVAERSEIHPLKGQYSFPIESSRPDGSYLRPFVNDRLNSRVSNSLPEGDWFVRSTTDLDPGSRPRHLLHAAGRTLVQGDGRWFLFDAELRRLQAGKVSGSDVLLDPANDRFYLADQIGMIGAFRLRDGTRQFGVSLTLGHSYHRNFIAKSNGKLLVTSTERQMGRESGVQAEYSTIEALKFSQPEVIDQDGVLRSGRVTESLVLKTLKLKTVLADKLLITATTGQIDFIDDELNVRSELTGNFEPVSLSATDGGLLYMVVSDGTSLRIRSITKAGERLFSAILGSSFEYAGYPPIIGYDHRVYLIGRGHLMALEQRGYYRWEYRTPASIAGAIITPGNELIVSSGSELGAFDGAGNYRRLYDFGNDVLETPPVLTDTGELLVAGSTKLFRLSITKP